MKTAVLFLSFFYINSFIVKSQNLVPNPSFEIYDFCPDDMTMTSVHKLLPDWYLPTRGTSDYFNECAKFQVGVPQNFIGNLYAFDGKAYTGIVLLEKPPIDDSVKEKMVNYREYLQAELIEPLEQNKKYCVTLNYAIANYSTYAINSLGICLTKNQIKSRASIKVLAYNPIVIVPADTVFTEKNYWYTLTDTIIAKGGEKYLTIGNFYDDTKTIYKTLDISELSPVLRIRISENKIASYYIDMISVQLIEK
jgi:hypothetical protein